MPQWRKLHVKSLDSLDIAEMPDDFTRLTWHLLSLVVDREGRAIDDAGWLRSKLFPLRRDVTPEMVEAAMAWYAGRGMIERYEVKGRRYFLVVKFSEYQGNTERDAASVIPAPVKQTRAKQVKPVTTNSGPTHEQVMSRSMPDVDVDAEERREENMGADAPAAPDPVKELANVFEQAAGIKMPAAKNQKDRKDIGVRWWDPLRQMTSMADGSAAEILRATIQHMRAEHLTIYAPGSCLKTFISRLGEYRTGGVNYATLQLRAAGYTDANGNPV